MISNAFTTFVPAGTVTIAGTTSSANVALNIGSNGVGERPQVRVYNAGTTPVFINFGGSAVTATTTSIPIPPGAATAIEKFSVPYGATHVAAIYGSGSGTVYFTSGFGA